jgi:hypothetical protein
MKLNFLMVALISAAGVFASAQSKPAIEPGPVEAMDSAAGEAVDILLMAKSADLAKFIKAGNSTTEVTRQYVQPGETIYNYTRQMCNVNGGIAGGACLGGAQMRIVVKYVQQGEQIKISSESRLSLIK